MEFEDLDVTPGGRYAYRLRFADGEPAGEVEVQVPEAPRFGLALAGAQPARAGDLRLRLTLESGRAASVVLYDVTGRRIAGESFAAGGGGTIEWRPRFKGASTPGVYLARLTQGEHAATLRFVVLE
jgi:hypothetical protein